MKKLRNLVLFIVIIFLFFIVFTMLPRNYEYKYSLGKFNIVESFDKQEKIYSYVFNIGKDEYKYSLEHKYINERGLIDNLKKEDNCIYAESEKLNNFNFCFDEEGYFSSYYDKEIKGQIIDEYENITVYDFNKKKYYIWNYTEFLTLKNNEQGNVELFENDVYELKLVTKLNNYLIVADYNQKYKFDKLYLINAKNNNVKEARLNREIYFNSYILGTHKKNIYLYDLQSELQYKINPFKETVSKNAYEILVNDQWEKVSKNKLDKKNITFESKQNFKYILEDGSLYYQTPNIKIKVTKLVVTNIVESNEKEAYFISDDTLYFVDINDGIKKIMSYTEWKFTNKNIYIF